MTSVTSDPNKRGRKESGLALRSLSSVLVGVSDKGVNQSPDGSSFALDMSTAQLNIPSHATNVHASLVRAAVPMQGDLAPVVGDDIQLTSLASDTTTQTNADFRFTQHYQNVLDIMQASYWFNVDDEEKIITDVPGSDNIVAWEPALVPPGVNIANVRFEGDAYNTDPNDPPSGVIALPEINGSSIFVPFGSTMRLAEPISTEESFHVSVVFRYDDGGDFREFSKVVSLYSSPDPALGITNADGRPSTGISSAIYQTYRPDNSNPEKFRWMRFDGSTLTASSATGPFISSEGTSPWHVLTILYDSANTDGQRYRIWFDGTMFTESTDQTPLGVGSSVQQLFLGDPAWAYNPESYNIEYAELIITPGGVGSLLEPRRYTEVHAALMCKYQQLDTPYIPNNDVYSSTTARRVQILDFGDNVFFTNGSLDDSYRTDVPFASYVSLDNSGVSDSWIDNLGPADHLSTQNLIVARSISSDVTCLLSKASGTGDRTPRSDFLVQNLSLGLSNNIDYYDPEAPAGDVSAGDLSGSYQNVLDVYNSRRWVLDDDVSPYQTTRVAFWHMGGFDIVNDAPSMTDLASIQAYAAQFTAKSITIFRAIFRDYPVEKILVFLPFPAPYNSIGDIDPTVLSMAREIDSAMVQAVGEEFTVDEVEIVFRPVEPGNTKFVNVFGTWTDMSWLWSATAYRRFALSGLVALDTDTDPTKELGYVIKQAIPAPKVSPLSNFSRVSGGLLRLQFPYEANIPYQPDLTTLVWQPDSWNHVYLADYTINNLGDFSWFQSFLSNAVQSRIQEVLLGGLTVTVALSGNNLQFRYQMTEPWAGFPSDYRLTLDYNGVLFPTSLETLTGSPLDTSELVHAVDLATSAVQVFDTTIDVSAYVSNAAQPFLFLEADFVQGGVNQLGELSRVLAMLPVDQSLAAGDYLDVRPRTALRVPCARVLKGGSPQQLTFRLVDSDRSSVNLGKDKPWSVHVLVEWDQRVDMDQLRGNFSETQYY